MMFKNKQKVLNEFIKVINSNFLENDSNTTDYILAEYLVNCLENYNILINKRD